MRRTTLLILLRRVWAVTLTRSAEPCAPEQKLGSRILGFSVEGGSFSHFEAFSDYENLGIALLCVIGAAFASGLTMAVVSLEAVT